MQRKFGIVVREFDWEGGVESLAVRELDRIVDRLKRIRTTEEAVEEEPQTVPPQRIRDFSIHLSVPSTSEGAATLDVFLARAIRSLPRLHYFALVFLSEESVSDTSPFASALLGPLLVAALSESPTLSQLLLCGIDIAPRNVPMFGTALQEIVFAGVQDSALALIRKAPGLQEVKVWREYTGEPTLLAEEWWGEETWKTVEDIEMAGFGGRSAKLLFDTWRSTLVVRSVSPSFLRPVLIFNAVATHYSRHYPSSIPLPPRTPHARNPRRPPQSSRPPPSPQELHLPPLARTSFFSQAPRRGGGQVARPRRAGDRVGERGAQLVAGELGAFALRSRGDGTRLMRFFADGMGALPRAVQATSHLDLEPHARSSLAPPLLSRTNSVSIQYSDVPFDLARSSLIAPATLLASRSPQLRRIRWFGADAGLWRGEDGGAWRWDDEEKRRKERGMMLVQGGLHGPEEWGIEEESEEDGEVFGEAEAPLLGL